MAFSLLHSWLLSPGSLMRTLVTQFSFVQHLPFWVLLLILLNAFISQCRREQRLISQWGCVVVVLSHSLLVAGQLGQPLWSVQVAVAEGKVSPEMNRPATRTSATSLLSHFIGQSESRDWAWLPRGREIQFFLRMEGKQILVMDPTTSLLSFCPLAYCCCFLLWSSSFLKCNGPYRRVYPQPGIEILLEADEPKTSTSNFHLSPEFHFVQVHIHPSFSDPRCDS